MEKAAIERDDLVRWTDLFQVPSREEMSLFDRALTLSP